MFGGAVAVAVDLEIGRSAVGGVVILETVGYVVDAREFDANFVVTTGSDDGFTDAKAVDAALDGVTRTVQNIAVERLSRGGICLEENLDPALEVESFVDGDILFDAADVEGLTWE